MSMITGGEELTLTTKLESVAMCNNVWENVKGELANFVWWDQIQYITTPRRTDSRLRLYLELVC